MQLKRAEQEIGVKLAEAMQRLEDPVQRQRAMVEEDRSAQVFKSRGACSHTAQVSSLKVYFFTQL